MPRITLVGSRKQEEDLSEFINCSDIVIRHTKLKGHGEAMGTKTDIWCVRTDGNPRKREHHTDEEFELMQDVSSKVPEIWITIPNHPIEEGQMDLDVEFPGLSRKVTNVMTRSYGIWERPSLGMLSLLHCLDRYPNHEMYLAGYSRSFEESRTNGLAFHYGDREFFYQQGLVDAGRVSRI